MVLTLGDARPKIKPDEAYRAIVHPVLAALGLVPGGELVHAEGTSQDLRAGIDWLVSGRDGAQTTIASRVQWDKERGTFSIRYRTEKGNMSELTKRYRTVMASGAYPTLTVQAYVERATGVLLNAYVVRTEDLYRHVIAALDDADHFRLCSCCGRPMWAPGGAQFIPVAVTEEARQTLGLRGTLIGHGVQVGMVASATLGNGFGL